MPKANESVPSVRPLSIVVLGATGDLAKKKIFPALFSLYSQNLIPPEFAIYGFARGAWDPEGLRKTLSERVTSRCASGESREAKTEAFLKRCHCVRGAYDSVDSFLDLYQEMRARQGSGPADRLYYMAIPPFLFLDVARAFGDAGLVNCGEKEEGFSRVVVEKPFGQDRQSSDALVESMAKIFIEQQTYRIDHYLGKEVIQDLIVLRFANRIFEPIWNRMHIASVHISFQEDFGVEGRAGYFDKYGIIRDIMQNHLLQILSLVAMERPCRFEARDVRDEKVKVLRRIAPLRAGDFALGQYAQTERDGRTFPAYTDDPGVPDDSITPTFAQAVLRIDNDRWDGVPFVLSAGKALEKRATEIRIRFRPVAENIFAKTSGDLEANELVICVQPDESFYLRFVNKTPGLRMDLERRDLDLRYESAYEADIPEAYESLIRDVIVGDKSLFIRKDELQAAWDIFTPALHELEERGEKPEAYAYGSRGPQSSLDQLARIH